MSTEIFTQLCTNQRPTAKSQNYQIWSKEELIREIQKLAKRKKYGVVWEDKPEAVADLCKEKLPVLAEDELKAVVSTEDAPVNILIEGDNYHALSVLNYTHKGRVDVIYIDPPFNTGNQSWKYNNDYVEKDDQWKHSKWLSFMDKRLRLAKRLLAPKGVLICAIDHNEQEGLGLLLQELFPSKEITCVTIVHNPRGIQGKNFAYCHEYAYFVYPPGDSIGRKQRQEEDKEFMNLRNWGGASRRRDGKSLFYPIYFKKGKLIKIGEVPQDSFHPKKAYLESKDGVVEIWPIDNKGIERKWRYSRASLAELTEDLRLASVGGALQVQLLKDEDRYKTVWIDTKYDANAYGTQLVRELIGKEFPFPKSLYTVKECLNAVALHNKNATVLDFFAGSGTTGHAVLEMNRADEGERRFILCTNNEGNICTEICHPRIKKVIQQLTKEARGEAGSGRPGGLKYFRTDFVEATPTDKNKKRLVDKSTEMLCLKEDCFDEVKRTVDYAIFRNEQGKHLGIVYEDDGIESFKREVKRLSRQTVVYVFSLDESAREEEFEDVRLLVDLKPIPAVILNVYKRIFK
ncbi:MAG: site-specific DNA-methyltransferase [Candidatus Omnitrophica bacterium]|nr:site-specific DNA-methyltransferase [Candidatus Omnitrophota bacterium]